MKKNNYSTALKTAKGARLLLEKTSSLPLEIKAKAIWKVAHSQTETSKLLVNLLSKDAKEKTQIRVLLNFSNPQATYLFLKSNFHLPQAIKEKAMEKVSSVPVRSYLLLKEFSDIPEEIEKKCVKTICNSYEYRIERLWDFLYVLSDRVRKERLIRAMVSHLAGAEIFLEKLYFSQPKIEKELILFEEIREEALKRIRFSPGTSYNILYQDQEKNKLPPGVKEKLIEVVSSSRVWAPDLVLNIQNLSKETEEKAIKISQKNWLGTKQAFSFIQSILPRWIAFPVWPGRELFIKRNQIPAFANREWKVINSNQGGVLIRAQYHQRIAKVVLLPDVSQKEKGYAISVPPEIKTVQKARAWMYQQDQKEFNGFTKEV